MLQQWAEDYGDGAGCSDPEFLGLAYTYRNSLGTRDEPLARHDSLKSQLLGFRVLGSRNVSSFLVLAYIP